MTSRLLSTILLAALLAVASLAGVGCPSSTGTTTHESLSFGGLDRTYRLHLPPDDGTGSLKPLLIVLHGSGGSGDDNFAKLTRFDEFADAYGFVAVFPDAVGGNWNDGRAVAGIPAYDYNIDDVGFVGALIDDVASKRPIDEHRVYVAGISNGAMMAYRLACELAQRIAAFATVAGAIPTNILTTCAPAVSVPLIAFNGTADPLIPWEGGALGTAASPQGTILSITNSVNLWVAINGCHPTPAITEEPDRNPQDGTRVYRSTYSNDNGQIRVVAYAIENGGHSWPGGPWYQVLWNRGNVCFDIDASSLIWDFCAQWTRE